MEMPEVVREQVLPDNDIVIPEKEERYNYYICTVRHVLRTKNDLKRYVKTYPNTELRIIRGKEVPIKEEVVRRVYID